MLLPITCIHPPKTKTSGPKALKAIFDLQPLRVQPRMIRRAPHASQRLLNYPNSPLEPSQSKVEAPEPLKLCSPGRPEKIGIDKAARHTSVIWPRIGRPSQSLQTLQKSLQIKLTSLQPIKLKNVQKSGVHVSYGERHLSPRYWTPHMARLTSLDT